MRYFVSLSFALFATACLSPSPARSGDFFVTIGGGPTPTNNQISLEKNVLFANRTLEKIYPNGVSHHIHFADGEAPARDLQYKDESKTYPPEVRWLSTILSSEDELEMDYKNHHDFPGQQAATEEQIEARLKGLAAKLGKGDRLFIYVAAHGSDENADDDFGFEQEKKPSSRNTNIALWKDGSVNVQEFTRWLDRFDPDVEIILVMAQCYSGGFAETIFRGGDRTNGMSARLRAGFFSQRHDRPAAGCTPEINEAEYEEYSTYFWAALSGFDRTGGTPVDADYDKDGRVSLSEAHAYAVITSDTIDVPILTSDTYLRHKIKLPSAKTDKSFDSELDRPKNPLRTLFENMFSGDSAPKHSDSIDEKSSAETLDALAKLGRPEQQAILRGLAEQLQLSMSSSLSEVQTIHKKILRKEKSFEAQMDTQMGKAVSARYDLLRELQEYDPRFELYRYSTALIDWTGSKSEEFVAFLDASEDAKIMQKSLAKALDLRKKTEEQTQLAARHERLIRTAQNILLEANLRTRNDATAIEHLDRLLRMESICLGTAPK